MVRMDARAEQISNNNTLIQIPYAPPDQPHDDELVCDHGVRCIIRVHAYLLPMVYCACQLPRTRGRRRKANIRTAFEAVQAVFEQHPITQRLAPHVLAEWQAWATDRVKVFQRASSAVEGRNGILSQLHHNQRGLPPRWYRVWTVVHNFDCHAADGTTPAAHFFRRPFPDLFETVLSHIEALPQPRRRKHQVALDH
jgi:hypothetical protein